MLRVQCGEVSERSKELAWKVSEGVKLLHGFKSHPLRHFLCFFPDFPKISHECVKRSAGFGMGVLQAVTAARGIYVRNSHLRGAASGMKKAPCPRGAFASSQVLRASLSLTVAARHIFRLDLYLFRLKLHAAAAQCGQEVDLREYLEHFAFRRGLGQRRAGA